MGSDNTFNHASAEACFPESAAVPSAPLAGVLGTRSSNFLRLTSSRTDNVSSLATCTHLTFRKVAKTSVKPHFCLPNRCFTRLPEAPRPHRRRPFWTPPELVFYDVPALSHQKRHVFPSLRCDGSDSQVCRMIALSWSSKMAQNDSRGLPSDVTF